MRSNKKATYQQKPPLPPSYRELLRFMQAKTSGGYFEALATGTGKNDDQISIEFHGGKSKIW